MNGILKLDNPILVNGKEVCELAYDTDEITAQMFAEADSAKMLAAQSKKGNMSGAVELDYSLHLYLGFMAIKAVNPELALEDLERIKGGDVMKVMRAGRNFIISRSEETSPPDKSENLSENTDALSAPPKGNSGKEGSKT